MYKKKVTSNYLYDQDGNRVSLANGTTTTDYPNKYYNYNGTKKTKQIYAGSQLVATVETVSGTATPYYDHIDQIGSTTATSDGSGALAETLDYYPYGSQRISSGSHTDQRQYVGQIYDTDTGLDYLNARYYKSDISRFVSEDPSFLVIGDEARVQSMTGKKPSDVLTDPQLLNSYSYAKNNPITLSDSQGKFIGLDDAAIGAIITSPEWTPVLAAGVMALATSIYYGTKAIVNNVSNSNWGGRYAGQMPQIDPTKFGLNQSPSGPEDWNPKNLDNKPKWVKWAVIGATAAATVADVAEKFKEVKETVKAFLSTASSTNTSKSNKKDKKSN